LTDSGVKDTKKFDSNKAKTIKCFPNFVVYTFLYNFATTMKKLRTIEMQRLSVDEFKQAEKLPLIVVLDDVRSMHNVGSVFRTGDAFRIEAVYLCGITSTPPSAEIHKTALGAEDSVEWKAFNSAQEALIALKEAGYEIYSIEQAHGSTKLQDFAPLPGKKYAVVLGNEVKGVHQEVIDASDGCLEIPQFGTKHSMNVSVTAGIIIWHFAEKLLF
jgi:tRNA G18 (ribose-2'-O)-methylase SpoU